MMTTLDLPGIDSKRSEEPIIEDNCVWKAPPEIWHDRSLALHVDNLDLILDTHMVP